MLSRPFLRRDMLRAKCDGAAYGRQGRASSYEAVCSDCVPPSPGQILDGTVHLIAAAAPSAHRVCRGNHLHRTRIWPETLPIVSAQTTRADVWRSFERSLCA